MAWRDHLGKVGGSLMGAGLALGVGYLITSHAVGRPSPHLTWPVWPYYLCAGMLAVGAFLYGTAHEMLPWQTRRALERRAEAAESALRDVRADLEKVQAERDEARRELADAQRAVIPPGRRPYAATARTTIRAERAVPAARRTQLSDRVSRRHPEPSRKPTGQRCATGVDRDIAAAAD